MEADKNTIFIKDFISEGGNIIKTRDDRNLIFIDEEGNFLDGGEEICSWKPDNNKVSNSIYRTRIEPWLTSLFQSEHLSLLVGSGISTAMNYKVGAGNGATMASATFSYYQQEIETAAESTARTCGRGKGNIEDQIRIANDLLRGLKILGKNEDAVALEENLNSVISNFAQSILNGENAIAEADEKRREEAYSTLVNFLLSFASRTGNRERLNIFTTNYDRLIEMGAELAGIHLMDRFVGTLMPIFRSSRLNLDLHYNPPGIRGEPRYLEGVARLTKLHGSVDWIQNDNEIRRIGLPFGAENIAPYLKAPGLKNNAPMKLMIYPNSAKDRETAEYPYVELFRDFAAAICRPNSTLVTYGYSFGDEHINRVIQDMLTIPSTHLVIISYDDPLNRMVKFYQESGHSAQMTILIGHNLGDLTNLANYYLPKAAIDRATIRMSELLRHRLGDHPDDSKESSPNGSVTSNILADINS